MYKRYEAKHSNSIVKIDNFSKMILCFILIFLLAFYNISDILSYFTSIASITNHFTMTAPYTVQFDANGGTGTTMPPQTMSIGTSANLTTNSYTRDGYTFVGWNTDSYGNGTGYTDGQSVTNLTNIPNTTVTLYAQWQIEDYNITYNLDEGNVTTGNPVTYNIETTTFTLNNPTKDGYTFKGWSGTDLTGDENTTVTIALGSTGNRTYTANYIPNTYYINFNANGGTGYMSTQTMTYGTSANLTTNSFEKTTYYFTEWNTEPDGSGESYWDGQNVNNLTTTNGDTIDLYAQWEEETNVAEVIGDRKYQTLQAAINAVQADNVQRTIKLLKSVQISSQLNVAANQNIVFDFRNLNVRNANNSMNIIKNYGTIEILRGTIQSSASYGAIDNEVTGRLTVSGGRVIATGTRQAIYNNGGIVEITGDAYLSASASDRATVQNNKPTSGNAGTITISGGTIVSTGVTTNRGAVENANTGTLIITGGTIISETKIGIDNKGTLIIGTENGDVDINSPVIQGATYGVSSSTAMVEFYDGIVKGKTNAFNNENNITEKEDNCEIMHSSEVINSDTYETAYLDYTILKLTFDGNGGTPAETIVYVENDTAIGNSMPEDPIRSCYHFEGWFTDPTNGTQITSATVVSSSDKYYAHWTKVQALVTFVAGENATSSESSREVNLGAMLGTLPTATKQYKTLAGWFTADTSGTQITANQVINDDVTYYAHWDPVIATVTLDPNGGTIPTTAGWTIDPQEGIASKTIEAGNTVGSLPEPTRANWDFVGWYTVAEGGTRVNQSEIIADTVTYYAHWTDASVAQIGLSKYATLQEAIDDVPTDNTETTITLLKNDLEAVSIVANKNIILDLDGYTLYNNGTKTAQSMNDSTKRPSVIENLGTLKIMNGTITTKSRQAAINTGTGSVIIENATISHTGTASDSRKQAIFLYSGLLLISGNSVISANNTGTYGGYDRGAIQNAGGTVIIKGGTITSISGPAVVNQKSAILELGEKDGNIGYITPVIQGKTYGVETAALGTFNFYDGIVKGVTASVNGTVSDTETGATRVDDTETIGSDTYNTTCYQ